jgi:hypothetical protein
MEQAMNETNHQPERDANGRFVPGRSGNPLGKKPGTHNRATVLCEALRDGEDAGVARVIIDKALAGNSAMARFVIGLLMPRPRDRAIEIDLPDGSSADDVIAASSATIQAMARGEITPEEALTVTRVLEFRLKAMTAAARERERELSPLHRKEPSPPLHRKEPSPLRQKEPSPPGRGQGEGAGRTPDIADIASARRPHPDPLPTGEGMAGSVRGSRKITEDLLHSTCISRPPLLFGVASPTPLPPSLTAARLAA